MSAFSPTQLSVSVSYKSCSTLLSQPVCDLCLIHLFARRPSVPSCCNKRNWHLIQMEEGVRCLNSQRLMFHICGRDRCRSHCGWMRGSWAMAHNLCFPLPCCLLTKCVYMWEIKMETYLWVLSFTRLRPQVVYFRLCDQSPWRQRILLLKLPHLLSFSFIAFLSLSTPTLTGKKVPTYTYNTTTTALSLDLLLRF